MSLELICGALLATDIPADDNLVNATGIKHLLGGIPAKATNGIRVAFQRSHWLETTLLDLQHRNLTALVTDKGMF